jgi:hypothetical protein
MLRRPAAQRRLLLGLAAPLVALALAGCGGGEGQEAAAPAATTGDAAGILASAGSETAEAGSSRVAFTIATEIPGVQEEPVEFTGEGAFDYAERTGSATFDFGELFASLGLPAADDPIQAIFDGPVIYLNFPLLAAFLPDAKPWIKLDPATLGEQQGLDLGQLQQLGQGDPSQLLDYLKATTAGVEEVGTEEVGGVETTHYRGTIQLDRVAEQVPPEQREQAEAAIDRLIEQTGATEIPVDAWVDGDGLVRRLEYSYSAEVQVPGSDPQKVASVVTMEFSDFGTAVDVEPPPADQVTDLAQLGAGSSG